MPAIRHPCSQQNAAVGEPGHCSPCLPRCPCDSSRRSSAAALLQGKDTCWAVKTPVRYYVSAYGQLTGGELAMMNEIHARGPITCRWV